MVSDNGGSNPYSRRNRHLQYYNYLAHLVEHQPFKPRVVGSIPTVFHLVSKLIEMSVWGPFRLPTLQVYGTPQVP